MRRRLLWLGLIAYAVLGVVLTLVPINPLDVGEGWHLDVPVNLVMFAPPAALALLVAPRLHPLVPVLVAAAASATIETLQALSPRDASLRDLVLNTVGAAIGAGIGWFLRQRSTRARVRRLES